MSTPTEALSWYLSFVDPDETALADEEIPGGPGFLGAAIITGDRPFVDAVRTAHMLGLNPGGSVQGLPVPTAAVPPRFRNSFIPRGIDMAMFEAEAELYVKELEVTPAMRTAFNAALALYTD